MRWLLVSFLSFRRPYVGNVIVSSSWLRARSRLNRSCLLSHGGCWRSRVGWCHFSVCRIVRCLSDRSRYLSKEIIDVKITGGRCYGVIVLVGIGTTYSKLDFSLDFGQVGFEFFAGLVEVQSRPYGSPCVDLMWSSRS